MKKYLSRIFVVIFGLIALIGGSMLSPTQSKLEAAVSLPAGCSYDLNDYYVIRMKKDSALAVWYYTATQSGVNPPRLDADGYRWYFIPKKDKPTRVKGLFEWINESQHSFKGYSGATDINGNFHKVNIWNASFFPEELEEYKIVTLLRANSTDLQKSRLVINVTDKDVTNLGLYCASYGIYEYYPASKFTSNGTLTIPYDKNTQTEWYLIDEDESNGRVSKITVPSGRGITATTGYFSDSWPKGSSRTYRTVHAAKIDVSKQTVTGDQNITVRHNVAVANVPFNFALESTPITPEANAALVYSNVEYFKVNGTTVPYTTYTKSDYTVPNSANVEIKLKANYTNDDYIFTRNFYYSNGIENLSVTTANLFKFKVVSDASSASEIIMSPFFKVNATFKERFKVFFKVTHPEEVLVRINGTEVSGLTSNYTWINPGEANPKITVENRNKTAGWKIYDFDLNGKKCNPYTSYSIESGSTVTINPTAYNRDKTVNIEYNHSKDTYLILDGNLNGKEYQYPLTAKTKKHAVKVHDEDFPLSYKSGHIFVNGLKVNGNFISRTDLTKYNSSTKTFDDKIEIFENNPATIKAEFLYRPAETLKFFLNGMPLNDFYKSPTIYCRPGDVMTITGSNPGELVEDGRGEVYKQDSNGVITIPMVDKSLSLSHHAAFPEITVESEIWEGVALEFNGKKFPLTGKTTSITLPWNGHKEAIYDMKISKESRNVQINKVESNPIGVIFNAPMLQISGVKGGQTIKLTTEHVSNIYTVSTNIQKPADVEGWRKQGNEWYVEQYNWDYGYSKEYCVRPPVRLEYSPIPGEDNYPSRILWGYGSSVGNNGEFKAGHFPMKFRIMPEYTHSEGYNEILCTLPINPSGDYYVYGDGVIESFPASALYSDILVTYEVPMNVEFQILTEMPEVSKVRISVQGGAKYYYSYSNRQAVEYDESKELYIPFANEFTIWTPNPEDYRIKFSDNSGTNYREVGLDSEGKYTEWMMNQCSDRNEAAYYNFLIEAIPMTFNVSVTNNGTLSTSNKIQITEVNPNLSSWQTPKSKTITNSGSLVESDNFSKLDQYKIVSTTSVLQVTGVNDKSTGNPLGYDPVTGIVTGIKRNMDIEVVLEDYPREKTMYVTLDNNEAVGSLNSIVLAPGTVMAKTITLGKNGAKTLVNYSDKDMPFATNISYGSSSKAEPNVIVIADNELYQIDPETGNYAFPDFAEGAELKIYRSTSHGNVNTVTYDIEDGLNISVLHNGQDVGGYSGIYKLSTGNTISFAENEGNEFDFVITKNGQPFSIDQTETLGVKDVNFTVKKQVNDITFNLGDGITYDQLRVTDAAGNEYPLTAAANKLTLSTRIKELFIATTQEGAYISNVATTGGFTFDPATGGLSSLATGTVTVTTKTFERSNDANFYIDAEGMSGATLTLGNGKTIKTDVSVESGVPVKFSDDDLPLIFKLPAGYFGMNENGEPNEAPDDEALLPGLYVGDELVKYSKEYNGFVLPEDAFKGGNAPKIRVYDSKVEPVQINFLVEPGIDFNAVPQNGDGEPFTEAGSFTYYPGTKIDITATPVKAGETIYILLDDNEVQKGNSLEYTYGVS
ncbi:MAG: hypothetical protein HDT01_03680, partial [Bacteroidales bacterium]|nr:hypothetical protein [Bacteroidales bacterium]